MPTYDFYLFLQNSQKWLFVDLEVNIEVIKFSSLDGEGAKGGWGDIESMSNKSYFWSSLKPQTSDLIVILNLF